MGPKESLKPLELDWLDPEQWAAFEMVKRHLDLTLAGKDPGLLRMITYGEGGTGKSQVIQTISRYFETRKVSDLLLKGAYMGIVTLIVEGFTIHHIGQISIQDPDHISKEAKRKKIFFK